MDKRLAGVESAIVQRRHEGERGQRLMVALGAKSNNRCESLIDTDLINWSRKM